jgi:hypothetical protein
MQHIIDKAKELAVDEINKYGVPKMEHFVLANEKGQQLAEQLEANKDIVLLGTMLMDLKIGQCMKEGRLSEHVQDSSLVAQEFLKQFDLDSENIKKIISCIESHHGLDDYYCLEAEICANSDCYRFLSPEGFFHGVLIFGNRLSDFNNALTQLENKVEEKHKIISLDICKRETEANYLDFKKLIKEAKRVKIK